MKCQVFDCIKNKGPKSGSLYILVIYQLQLAPAPMPVILLLVMILAWY